MQEISVNIFSGIRNSMVGSEGIPPAELVIDRSNMDYFEITTPIDSISRFVL